MTLTDDLLALFARAASDIPAQTLQLARMSLFDWCTCALGALDQPVSEKLIAHIAPSIGHGQSSVFGGGQYPSQQAALANGTISHALDYDDTHFAHIGHLSVAIFPAVLAAAQEKDVGLNEVVTAFLCGAEAAIRVGLVLGSEHYENGFHQTATAGAFGATLAAARIYGLSTDQCRAALGLCSTRASGLKNQFGTMGKPLNAGIAASNGIECAKLASLGMTTAADGLEGPQGFIATHATSPGDAPGTDRFLFDDIRFKLHACCHGTHAMIEALQHLVEQNGLGDDVETITVRTHPKWLNVCDIEHPTTGLEVKFSYAWLAAMVLQHIPLADPEIFVDTLCQKDDLKQLASRVTVIEDANLPDTASKVTLTVSGQTGFHEAYYDLMDPIPGDALAGKLRDKSTAMHGDHALALWQMVFDESAVKARSLSRLMHKD